MSMFLWGGRPCTEICFVSLWARVRETPARRLGTAMTSSGHVTSSVTARPLSCEAPNIYSTLFVENDSKKVRKKQQQQKTDRQASMTVKRAQSVTVADTSKFVHKKSL